MMNRASVDVGLTGIPETLLWPLYCRAEESLRPDTFLPDPLAVEIYRSIDYPFRDRFGSPRAVLALRAHTFDREIEKVIARRPDATVVALGDGLETQFHRVDNGRVRWVSVDLPETIDLRRALLPTHPRTSEIACSALDPAWMDRIPETDGLFITALGLFMYLDGNEVLGIIEQCAGRFPGASLLFDAVPPWLIQETDEGTRLNRLMMRGRSGADTYRLPPMVWGTTTDSVRDRLRGVPGVRAVHDIAMAPGRGLVFAHLNPTFGSLPGIRSIRPNNILVEFC